MGEDSASLLEADDPAYPTTTAADPLYPCQTQEPLLPVFDGVALPSTWARLGDALDRAFAELWRAHGMADRYRPRHWVSLHYGRIYVNAHAFERLRALVVGESADRNLAPPADGVLAQIREWDERRQARRQQPAYAARLQRAEERASPILERVATLDLVDTDTAELARGPLDRSAWAELLLPWLATRLTPTEASRASAPSPVFLSFVREGIRFEQRCAAELGRRLVRMRICTIPSDIVYLTVEERIAAVQDTSIHVTRCVARRRMRVEAFSKLDAPTSFWGELRLGAEDRLAADGEDERTEKETP